MARGPQKVKAIENVIARLEAEQTAYNARMNGRLEGLREALALQNGEPVQIQTDLGLPESPKRKRRGNLKQTVLDLATEMGDRGITADACVSMAKYRGIDLIYSSVSSLLSRLKQDGVLFFDGQVYRLKQYAGPREAA